MTIVHLINSIGGGGAEQMVYQLSKRSCPKHKTFVIALSDKNTLEEKFNQENIKVYYLGIESFKDFSFITGFKKLKSLLKNEPKLVLHCHQYYAGLLGMYYKLVVNSKTPIIFTLHTNKLDAVIRRLLLFLMRPLRKVDVIFSKGAKKWYLKNNAILPNGIDFDALKITIEREYNTSETFSFLFLGRINPAKNPLYLVSVAKKLIAKDIRNFVINVVGDGNLSVDLKLEIERNNLEDYIILHGYQEVTKPFLEKTDCLILPSKREGMPMVILEAAAANLPIISTPVGSIPDFLNNSNAKIVDLDSFDLAMEDIMKNYDVALLKSTKLLSDISNEFDIDLVFRKHLNLYKSLTVK